MDMPHLGDRHQLAGGPVVGGQDLLIHPLGRLGIALDLQVLGELLVADGPPLLEEELDLAEDEGVPLDGGGVVGLLVPDVAPDVLGLDRGRQPTEAAAEFLHAFLELAVDGLTASPPPSGPSGHGNRVAEFASLTPKKWTRRKLRGIGRGNWRRLGPRNW